MEARDAPSLTVVPMAVWSTKCSVVIAETKAERRSLSSISSIIRYAICRQQTSKGESSDHSVAIRVTLGAEETARRSLQIARVMHAVESWRKGLDRSTVPRHCYDDARDDRNDTSSRRYETVSHVDT